MPPAQSKQLAGRTIRAQHKTPVRPAQRSKPDVGAGGVGKKGKGGRKGRGAREEDEDEEGGGEVEDVSLEPGDLLGVSSQLSSDAGNAMPSHAWSQAISDEVRKKHRQAAEKVIKDFKEEEGRINKKQKMMLEDFNAQLLLLQTDMLKQLEANSQAMVKTLTKRMAHERLIGAKVDQTIKGTVAAVAETDKAVDRCLKEMQDSVREDELIGETAAWRLSAPAEGMIDEQQKRTGNASKIKSKLFANSKTVSGTALKPVKVNVAATGPARAIKKPRKTDDTLVGSDNE